MEFGELQRLVELLVEKAADFEGSVGVRCFFSRKEVHPAAGHV